MRIWCLIFPIYQNNLHNNTTQQKLSRTIERTSLIKSNLEVLDNPFNSPHQTSYLKRKKKREQKIKKVHLQRQEGNDQVRLHWCNNLSNWIQDHSECKCKPEMKRWKELVVCFLWNLCGWMNDSCVPTYLLERFCGGWSYQSTGTASPSLSVDRFAEKRIYKRAGCGWLGLFGLWPVTGSNKSTNGRHKIIKEKYRTDYFKVHNYLLRLKKNDLPHNSTIRNCNILYK